MLAVLVYLVLIFLVAIVAVVGFASMRPSNFHVGRSTTIAAPPERIFALINDFREWPKWSPWERLDPDLRRSFSGAERGVGSVYEWEGNRQVGAGRMEIVQSQSPSRVGINLSFLKPFKAENATVFSITTDGARSVVQWDMTGTSNLMFKIVGLFMSMDKMVGSDFERGLAAMKDVAEKG